jgi:hypothetical protein
MPRYKISDRVPQEILDASSKLVPLIYPFHRLSGSRFATDEQFARELKERFKAIPYPYKLARAKGTQPPSTYQVLCKRGAVDALFQPSVINSLRLWVEDSLQWFHIRQLGFASTEAGKKFREFHTPFAADLVRHVNVIRNLRASYELAEEWMGPYVRTVEERLMYEVALLRMFTDERQESDAKATRQFVKLVELDISGALEKAHNRNKALAYHLTSILCSPNCLITKTLSPTPEGVRKLVTRDPVKKKNKSSN